MHESAVLILPPHGTSERWCPLLSCDIRSMLPSRSTASATLSEGLSRTRSLGQSIADHGPVGEGLGDECALDVDSTPPNAQTEDYTGCTSPLGRFGWGRKGCMAVLVGKARSTRGGA